MTTTIARQARIRFADQTAPLAQVVINARFAAIVEDLITEIKTDLDKEFDFDCEMYGDGTDEIFHRITENGEPVEACERCVDEHHLGYVAE